jgi:hypothetical protein
MLLKPHLDSRAFREGIENVFGASVFSLIKFLIQRHVDSPWTQIHYHWVEEYALLYSVETVDELNKAGQGIFSFSWCDDIFDYTEIAAKTSPLLPEPVRWMSNPVVAALELGSGFQVDSWVRSIPVRASYLLGKKYRQVRVEVDELSLDDLLFNSRCLFEHKKHRYPDLVFASEWERLFYRLIGATKCYSVRGYDEGGGWLFTTLCHARAPHLMSGTFIDLTTDASLLKKHRCYMLGHTEVVRLASSLGYDRVEFGFYLDYKKCLNFQAVERPSLDVFGTGKYKTWPQKQALNPL